MKKEAARRIRVTEEDCRKAELMARGGATLKEISELVGKDQTTLSRMKKAGYSLEKYNEITAARKKRFAKEPAEEPQPEIEGQIEMELTTEKTEMSEQTKMMRFQAAQIDKLIMKLDQIYNMTSMILRAVRGE